MANTRSSNSRRDSHFEMTHWSIVRAAGRETPEARAAMEHLCGRYWYPLYAFVRRQQHTADEAQDLTQEFFARLLEKDWLAAVRSEKGRFRSFLLAAMKHFLSNERDRHRAQKRGGRKALISLAAAAAESRYATEPAIGETPETIFQRRWAITLLEQVMSRLRGEFESAGKSDVFDELKTALTGDDAPYAEIGKRLGMNEGAVKTAVHRLRRRYRDLIRDEIAQTVDGPSEVEDELRELMAALAQ